MCRWQGKNIQCSSKPPELNSDLWITDALILAATSQLWTISIIIILSLLVSCINLTLCIPDNDTVYNHPIMHTNYGIPRMWYIASGCWNWTVNGECAVLNWNSEMYRTVADRSAVRSRVVTQEISIISCCKLNLLYWYNIPMIYLQEII